MSDDGKSKKPIDPYGFLWFAIAIGGGILLGRTMENHSAGVAIGIVLWPIIASVGRRFMKRNQPEEPVTQENEEQESR